MDRRIRILGLILISCFCLLFLQLNNWQVRDASALQSNPDNPSENPVATWYQNPRGAILANNGQVLANSSRTSKGYERHYLNGPLFADITGYFDATAESATGLDGEYDSFLVQHQSRSSNLSQTLTQQTSTDSVVSTISPSVQETAARALGHLRGAVVAVKISTGAIEAMYSNPTFDPNKMSVLNAKSADEYYNSLQPQSGSSPLVNGVTQFRIQPGSTFKVITSAAVFDRAADISQIIWPVVPFIHLPQTTKTLQNFNGESCGGTLAMSLASSCDTAFAQIGMALGAHNLAAEAQGFGFNQKPPIDLPEAVASFFPSATSIENNKPVTAYSSIGQENVAETPLQDALVAAAIGDSGRIMTPHVMNEIVSDSGQVVNTFKPHLWIQATSSATAQKVLSLMRGVVTNGTASGVFSSSLDVAAKTGTAETGASGCSADWMIAISPAGDGDIPDIAVAAVIPAQTGISCSETGAEAAGPIVNQVLAAAEA